MRTAPPPLDPEFDRPARTTRSIPPAGEIGFHQRLVVNPFLAFVWSFAVIAVVHSLPTSLTPPIKPLLNLLAVFAGPILSTFAFQYHCIDCGTTGWYHRWNRHACHRVVERWRTRFSAASHFFPMPTTQFAIWTIVVIAAFAVVGLLVSESS